MDAGLLKDTYELAYTWAPNGMSVSWDLVSAQLQKTQHGSYVLKPAGSGTEVTYTLAVDLTVPMIGVLRRKAEKIDPGHRAEGVAQAGRGAMSGSG